MDLGDIYQSNVNKNPIKGEGISSGIPSSRERDPNQVKLEQNVFAKMRAAIPKPPTVDNKPVQKTNVENIGLEQALKELLDSTESIDDKS